MSKSVQEHFNHVRDQWELFASDEEARVLCWKVSRDGFDVLRAFHEYESSEEKELPHLFIPCAEVCSDPVDFDKQLNRNLNALIEATEENGDFDEMIEGFTEDELHVQNLAQLASQLEDCLELVCVNLFDAQSIEHPRVREWLQTQLEREAWDSRVRIAFLDFEGTDVCFDLDSKNKGRLVVASVDASVAEMAEQEAQDNPAQGPGPDFQKSFSSLNEATASGNRDKAQKQAEKANKIAEQENWPAMQVAVAFQLGAGASKEEDFDSALVHYQEAEEYADKAKDQGEPGADKLKYQSLLAQASVELPRSHYSRAVILYVKAAGIAQEIEEFMVCMDSWRMASFCHERLLTENDKDLIEGFETGQCLSLAWEYGQKAVEYALELDEETRQASTAPYVGDALLRLRDKHGALMGDVVLEEQLLEMLGSDWKNVIKEVRQ